MKKYFAFFILECQIQPQAQVEKIIEKKTTKQKKQLNVYLEAKTNKHSPSNWTVAIHTGKTLHKVCL